MSSASSITSLARLTTSSRSSVSASMLAEVDMLLRLFHQTHDCEDVLFRFGNGILLSRELRLELGDGALEHRLVERVADVALLEVCHVFLLVLSASLLTVRIYCVSIVVSSASLAYILFVRARHFGVRAREFVA